MEEITKQTTFTGYDNEEYEARATLTIEDDGTLWVSQYEYRDGETWKNTEERDKWSPEEIEELFGEDLRLLKKAPENFGGGG